MQPGPSATTHAAIALLEKTPQLLETMLGGVAPDILHWKPSPDRWSISEVLSHLAHSEDCLNQRVRSFVLENTPDLREYEPPAEGFSAGTAQEHLSRFAQTRRGLVHFLRTLPAEAGARTAQHSKLGMVTLEQMLNEWACHDLGHIRQIAELYRARAFHPNAGPFSVYQTLHP
ncbi:MAG: DinB family protein [Acidobacteria bacterium]|nr:DinB family protein [Acidobacteriota bacterium]